MSKRQIELLFAAWTAGMALAACAGGEVDDVFGQSAADRVATSQSRYYALLQGEPQGWVMDFYPADRQQGGVAYTAQFAADGMATIACAQTIINSVTAQTYAAGTTASSLYQVVGEKGVLLTFDTYNPLLHYWSQPFSGHAHGYESDYEFIFLTATPDSIVLQGKRHGNLLRLYPLGQQTAADYIARTQAMNATLDATVRKRALAGGSTHRVTLAYRQMSYTADDGTPRQMPFTYTDRGLRFYEPVALPGGTTIGELVYDADADELTTPDGSVTLPSPTATERFVGTTTQWYFGYTKSGGPTDMCNALADIVTDCATRIRTPNWGYEVLSAVYLGGNLLGTESDTHRTVIGWCTNENYGYGRAAYFGYGLTMDIENDARQTVSLQPTEAATGFAGRAYCQTFVDYIAQGSPYHIAFDADDRVTLTSAADATCWFSLTRSSATK